MLCNTFEGTKYFAFQLKRTCYCSFGCQSAGSADAGSQDNQCTCNQSFEFGLTYMCMQDKDKHTASFPGLVCCKRSRDACQ